MKVFYPAIITSAIFFAAITVNLHERNYGTALFMSLLAIPSIILQVLLTQKGFDIVGYIIVIVPIILVYIGYSLGVKTNEINRTYAKIDIVDTFKNKSIEEVPERIEAKMS